MAVIWNIVNTERDTLHNGIILAHWCVSEGEEVGEGSSAVLHTGLINGVQSFTPNHMEENFIAYTNITESNVIEWVHSSLGSDVVADIEASLSTQINLSKASRKSHGRPWS